MQLPFPSLPLQDTSFRRKNMEIPSTSTILCLLTYFHLLLLHNKIGLAAALHSQQCSPSSCGNIDNISYPLRLRSDPSGCGDPNYELVCEDNRTVLYLTPENKFYVTEISYEFSSVDYSSGFLNIVDVDLASGNCTLPSPSKSSLVDVFGVKVHSTKFFEPQAWATFMNCSREIHDQIDDYRLVPCLSRKGNTVYVINDYRSYTIGYYQPHCQFIVSVPVNETFHNGSQQDIFQQLQKGFPVGWSNFESDGQISQAEIVGRCFRKMTWSIKEFIEHRPIDSLYEIVTLPFSFQPDFFSCISGYWYHTQSTWRVALVLMVLLDIVLYTLVLVILARHIFATFAILLFLAYKLWKAYAHIDIIEKFLKNQESLSTVRFSYPDIVAMTNNFREELGKGGFGSVFKGLLAGHQLVAVKMLIGNSKFNGEEFINEVSTIGRIHHINIVRLVGFCSEGPKRALIYEYMANGSLDKYIFASEGRNRYFTKEKINEIAVAVAKGIDYLHRGCDKRILHFDIKPHNILLDKNFNPKLSDFGLAKLYPKEYSLVSISAARGTVGYIAPELVSRSFGVISYKSDVYSFGMLLMEMAGGRRNVDNRVENASQVYYPSWIYDKLQPSDGLEISNAIEIDDTERKLCKVGLWCIQMRPADRPSMSKVIEMLEADSDTLEMPPKPFASNSLPMSIGQSSMESTLPELSIISEN